MKKSFFSQHLKVAVGVVLSILILSFFVLSPVEAAKKKRSPKIYARLVRWDLRWDENGKKRLAVDMLDKNGHLVRTFRPYLQHSGKDIFFLIKGLHWDIQFTVPDGWVIDCKHDAVDGVSCKGTPTKSGGRRFTAGETAILRDIGNDLFIHRADGGEPPDPTVVENALSFPNNHHLHKKTRVLWMRDWELSADGKILEIKTQKKDGKLSLVLSPERQTPGDDDFFKIEGITNWSQFTLPAGWMIDCDPECAEGLGCKGEETQVGGLRFFEGDTVLLKNSGTADVTIRRMYE